MWSATPGTLTSRLAKCGLAACLLLALGACGGGAQQTGIAASRDAAALTQMALTPADVAALSSTCQQAQPALAVATDKGMPATLSSTAVYPAAYCKQLLAGTPPPTSDKSTLTWLPQVLAATEDAAQIARVVLPVALKALPLVAMAL